MTPETDLTLLHQAKALLDKGLLAESESILLRLQDEARVDNLRAEVLRALTQIYLNSQREEKAVATLLELIRLAPGQLHYCDTLADLYIKANRGADAIACYQAFIERNPASADGHFNFAFTLRSMGHYEEALLHYQLAIQNNVKHPEQVFLNMAVIYSDHLRQEDDARHALATALEIDPEYTPALYNLAGLYEEEGDRVQASALFERVIALDSTQYQALSRLADLTRFADAKHPYITSLRAAVADRAVDSSTRTNLLYSLGQAMNSCECYEQAASFYDQANALNAAEVGRYQRDVQQGTIDELIAFFTSNWFADALPVSAAAPVFICGMFRSGSTLTEQILGSHPLITAGGEREFFPRLVHRELQPFPAALARLAPDDFAAIANRYLEELTGAFPDARIVTDKRPDNFLYLGLILRLFPNAKIIHTVRNPLDNCLSIYFLRLAAAMNYATRLEDIAHFYNQQARLMHHWRSLFPGQIFTLNYDDLVADPRPTIKPLLDFLDVEWHEDCLDFHNLRNRVKTASVWQVRQPLHSQSSGRWQHYPGYAQRISAALSHDSR